MELVKNVVNVISRSLVIEPAMLFTLIFVAFMLWAAMFYFMFYWCPICSRESAIKRLIADLREIPESEKRLNTLKEQATSEEMKERNRGLFQQWKQYSRHIILIGRKDFSTVGAEEYFNFECLSGGINAGLWNNLGSVFTGLGILGTFVGFSWGLITINQIGSAESVNQLLSGVKTAFFTSIAGIICALVFNFVHGRLTHSFQSAVEEFAGIVDALIPLTTQEALLAQILRENDRQTKSLNSLKQGIQDDVREILEEMQDKMNEALSVAFSNSVNENFKPVFEELTTSIRHLSEAGEKAIVKELKKGAGKALNEFKSDVSEMNEEMKRTMSEGMVAVNTAKDTVEASVGLVESAKDLVESLNSGVKDMKETIAPFEKTAELMEQSSQGMQQSVDKISGAVTTIGAASEDIKAFYNTQDQTFGSLSKDIAASSETLGNSLANYRDEYVQTLRQYDDSMNKAFFGLKDVAEVLRNAGGRLTQDVQILHAMVGGMRR